MKVVKEDEFELLVDSAERIAITVKGIFPNTFTARALARRHKISKEKALSTIIWIAMYGHVKEHTDGRSLFFSIELELSERLLMLEKIRKQHPEWSNDLDKIKVHIMNKITATKDSPKIVKAPMPEKFK